MNTCNVCDSRLVNRFSRVIDPLTNEAFSIHSCTNCGLGHTIPHPVELGRYYGPVYYGNRHSFTSNYCTRRRLKFLFTMVDRACGKRLLDIGCGDGSFLLAAKGEGFEVMGTEINPGQARSAGLDVREKIEEVPDSEQFDFITMWHSIEHMKDIKSSLCQLSVRLKPKGKLLVAVPDNGGLQAKLFRNKWLHLDVPRHLYHFDGESLSFCMKQVGFTVEKKWHQELEYDLIGLSQSTLNYISPHANVFFDFLAGKQGEYGVTTKISNFILGSILSALFFPVVPLATLLGRGGTLVVACCKRLRIQ